MRLLTSVETSCQVTNMLVTSPQVTNMLVTSPQVGNLMNIIIQGLQLAHAA